MIGIAQLGGSVNFEQEAVACTTIQCAKTKTVCAQVVPRIESVRSPDAVLVCVHIAVSYAHSRSACRE